MRKVLFFIPLLILLVFAMSPVHAVWLEGYQICKDITITETSGITVADKPLEFVVYGMTNKTSTNNDVRLVNGKCGLSNTTILFNILSSTSDSVEFRIKQTLSVGAVLNLSVYYNNSAATSPNYGQIATYTESFEDASLNTTSWIQSTNDIGSGNISTDYARYGSKSWKTTFASDGKYNQLLRSPSSKGTYTVWIHDDGDTSFQTGIELSVASGGNGGWIHTDYSTTNYTVRVNSIYEVTNISRVSAGNWFKVTAVMYAPAGNRMFLYIQNKSVVFKDSADYSVSQVNLYGGTYIGTGYTDMYEEFYDMYDNPSQIFAVANGTEQGEPPVIPPLQELSITLDAPANVSYRDNSSVRLEQTVNRINYTMGYCEYSLDGLAPVNTSCMNVSIPLTYYGDHTLQVFANGINLTADWFKNSSDILYFSNPSSTQNFSSCFEITEYGQYYLQDDILDSGESQCILISTDNVLIDCLGHIIDGIDSSGTYGIISEGFDNVTAKNCVVSDWYYGMNFATGTDFEFDNISVSSCTVGGTPAGIYLDSVDNIVMHDSEVYDSVTGVYFNTVTGSYFYNNIFRDNTEAFTIDAGLSSSNVWNNTFNSTDVNINVQSPPLDANNWNNTSGGNYYFSSIGDGFSDTCNANIFGFCDTSYVIDSPDNIDNLPLTHNPYVVPDTGFTVEIIYPVNSSYRNATAMNVTWVVTRKTNVTITLCRYSLDGSANITLASCQNITLTNLTYGDHYIDVFVNGTNLIDNSSMFNSSSVNFNTYFVNETVIPPIIPLSAPLFNIVNLILVIMVFGLLYVEIRIITQKKKGMTLDETIEFVVILFIMLIVTGFIVSLI